MPSHAKYFLEKTFADYCYENSNLLELAEALRNGGEGISLVGKTVSESEKVPQIKLGLAKMLFTDVSGALAPSETLESLVATWAQVDESEVVIDSLGDIRVDETGFVSNERLSDFYSWVFNNWLPGPGR